MKNKTVMAASFALVILALFFWDSIFVLPVKYLTVFFHELSHGLAAVFTGGKMLKINLDFQQGGLTYTQGGIRWVVVSAGYLGSLLWGALILILNCKYNLGAALLRFLAALLFCAVAFFIRNAEGVVICLSLAALFFLISKYARSYISEVLVNAMGLISCLYVVYDIRDDLLMRTVSNSDASVLAKMWGVPAWFIGLVWFIIAAVAVYQLIKFSLGVRVKKSH